jgi:RHS repeat-associated protein
MWQDPVTGLYYTPNRDYSAALGRWLEADPDGYVDGSNDYQAFDANPVGLCDAEGTDADLEMDAGSLVPAPHGNYGTDYGAIYTIIGAAGDIGYQTIDNNWTFTCNNRQVIRIHNQKEELAPLTNKGQFVDNIFNDAANQHMVQRVQAAVGRVCHLQQVSKYSVTLFKSATVTMRKDGKETAGVPYDPQVHGGGDIKDEIWKDKFKNISNGMQVSSPTDFFGADDKPMPNGTGGFIQNPGSYFHAVDGSGDVVGVQGVGAPLFTFSHVDTFDADFNQALAPSNQKRSIAFTNVGDAAKTLDFPPPGGGG